MKKLFISQPMKGKSDEEILKEREKAIQSALRNLGEPVEVIESYFEDYNPENGCIPLKYLAKSLDLLADADVAYFAKGWENTRGCKIENQCAIEYGITVIEDYTEEQSRMTKKELFEKYEEAKTRGISCVVLFIHMPTGETEAITNPNVEEKMKYIDKTYDENLVHANCKDIFIEEVLFPDDKDTFDFGMALDALKNGGRVSRKGWNGKGQYIELASNISYQDSKGCIVNCDHDAIGNQAIAFVGTSGVQMGWLASQADMLAEDWYELEEDMLKDVACEAGMEAGMPVLAPAAE